MADSDKKPTKKISWRKKLLFSLVATAGFFVLVESSLALLGVRPETDTSDPFVGFDQQIPLMNVSRDESGRHIVSTAANKLIWFNSQSFPKEKATGTKRVFCLGGSTTFGRPYDDVTSYSGWLRELLPRADASHRWEVINAGGVSYASYRVAAIMEELVQYDPDLFIVYSAHNEFLERRTYEGMFDQPDWSLRANSTLRGTRTWSLLQSLAGKIRSSQTVTSKETLTGEVDEMLNHSVGPSQYHRDPQWRKNVIRHYETNLHRMVEIAESAEARVLLITPASNEKDSSPFKSEFSEGLGDKAIDLFHLALDRAESESDAGDFSAALTHLQEAAAIDDRYAHLHYKMGRLLFRMGKYSDAQTAYMRAIDEDICPLRAVSEISTAIRRIARERNTPLLDFETQLRAKCRQQWQHECLGGEYFLDHVHPTIDIHRQLALWIIDAMGKYDLAAPTPLTAADIDQVIDKIHGKIDPHAQGVALRNLAKVLHWAGKFAEAEPRAADALTLIPNDLESRYVLADCLINLGKRDEGFREYQKLFRGGDFPPAYRPYGELLAERNDLAAARDYLTLAVAVADTDVRLARAQYSLGHVYLQLKDFDLALEPLQVANKLYPNDPSTLLLLAEANTGLGQTDQAIQFLQRVVHIDPDHSDAHNRLGLAYLKSNQIDQSIHHFELAIAADPEGTEARKNIIVAKSINKDR